MEPPPAITQTLHEPRFTVAHQKVELDLNFSQQVAGKTEITIYPESLDLKQVKLHARQCRIDKVLINGIPPASVRHQDPCDQLALHFNATVHQHHILANKIEGSIGAKPAPDLIITLPRKLKIESVDLAEVHLQNASTIKIPNPDAGGLDTTETAQGLSDTSVAKFTPLTFSIEFFSIHTREALQYVSGKRGSGRWPHIYTRGQIGRSNASALFPCLDLTSSRCTWDLSIRCARTVGAALAQGSLHDLAEKLTLDSTARDKSMSSYEGREMVVLCTGELTDEITDKMDSTAKTVSFSCSQQLSPQQIGFAIGPFDLVNLSELRDAQEVEELGRNAVEVFAYCLPGRKEETRNTCLPTTQAIDYIVRKYSACPVRAYVMCFVEDMATQTSIFAGVTMCNTGLIYPENVLDPAQEVTRSLVHAIATQWSGMNVIPEDSRDAWIIIGMAEFITDLFMKDLCGNNEYRYRIKQQSDRVYEMDQNRPSIYEMGALLHIDPAEYEFLTIKAPLVLFILDRRIAKVAGISKMPAIIAKILTRARTGDLPNNALSSEAFQKTCEKFYHAKIDDFVSQWIKGAGCPRFQAYQRFNKKKLVVEMLIKQTQGNSIQDRDLDPDSFMRDAREEFQQVYAAQSQTVFTGPMTIRIHEADGTPYEHIVEIKDASTTIDIPYNTKYKRLKRNKKQKSRNTTKVVTDTGEDETDALVYCLGDVLQSEDEIFNWRISEWSVEDEEKMNTESYEWIRLDADFEWICRINLQMPGYMFTSQLQQDRDVVAQLEAVRHIAGYNASPLISSIFIRTLMDKRYFHGVRALAARSLIKHAKAENDAKYIGLFHLKKAFEELYCQIDHGSAMTRPNDFTDQLSYILQCEIIEALSEVRDDKGHTPREVKEFLLDKLKFNDNSINEYSDAHYVARLMTAVCNAFVARPKQVVGAEDMDIDLEDELHEMHQLERECLAETDRYRRMDEWTSSYQNLYSRTALECQALLSNSGIGSFSPLHFLQYTRPGNYDLLRSAAYKILVQPEILEKPSVLKYALHCSVADSSPWIRQTLQVAFGKVLAKRAIGSKRPEQQQIVNDGLVIEDANMTDANHLAVARRQTIEGALAALKKELGDYQPLKETLWSAVSYPEISLDDLQVLLDFCEMLYEPKDSVKTVLRLPHYWKVQNLGKGKLKFSQTSAVRTKILPKWQPPVTHIQPRPDLVPKTSNPALKLTFKKHKTSQSKKNSPAPTPPPPKIQTAPVAQGPGRVVLKLKAPKPSQ